MISSAEGRINCTQFMTHRHHQSLQSPALVAFIFICLCTHTTFKSPILKTDNHLNVCNIFFFACAYINVHYFVSTCIFNSYKWYCTIYCCLFLSQCFYDPSKLLHKDKFVAFNYCIILVV